MFACPVSQPRLSPASGTLREQEHAPDCAVRDYDSFLIGEWNRVSNNHRHDGARWLFVSTPDGRVSHAI